MQQQGNVILLLYLFNHSFREMQASLSCLKGEGDAELCHSWLWIIGNGGGLVLALVVVTDLLYKQPWLYSVRVLSSCWASLTRFFRFPSLPCLWFSLSLKSSTRWSLETYRTTPSNSLFSHLFSELWQQPFGSSRSMPWRDHTVGFFVSGEF